jgi:hypothetical protein
VGATGSLSATPTLALRQLSLGVYLVFEPTEEAVSSRRRRLSNVIAGVLSVGTDTGSELSFVR